MKPPEGPATRLAPVPLARLAEQPLVSVLISNYNYAQFVGRAVESVRAQTYAPLEIVVVDDGSTDGSRGIIERLAAADPRVRAIYQPNQGQAAAWNTAFAVARGDILCFLDPDDLFAPTKVEAVVAALRAQPSAGLACHRLQQVTADGVNAGIAIPRKLARGGALGPDELPRAWGQWPPTSGIAIRREIAERVFPLPSQFRTGSGDGYIAATARLLSDVVAIDAALGVYRIHGTNNYAALRPNPASLALILDSLDPLLSAIRAFVSRSGRPDLGDRLTIDRLGMYWEHQLASTLLSPSHSWRTGLRAARGTTRRIVDTKRRWLWRGLLILPPPVATWALSASWGASRWRRAFSFLATRLGA